MESLGNELGICSVASRVYNRNYQCHENQNPAKTKSSHVFCFSVQALTCTMEIEKLEEEVESCILWKEVKWELEWEGSREKQYNILFIY